MDLSNTLVSVICIFIVSHTVRNVSAIRWEFKDVFEPGNVLYVKETMNVELCCSKVAKSTVSFISWSPEGTLSDKSITLFNASRPTTRSNKYYFSELSDTFTLYDMGKQDGGNYYCSQILQPYGRPRLLYVILKVVKIPKEKPICSTNYRYPVIFHDEMKDNFEFNCSTETGNPPLKIDIFVDDAIFSPDTSWTKNGVTTLSTITYMTEGLNNSTYSCSVRQELPFPYNERYEETCSFGPMHILPGFNITITPTSAFFKEGDNVTFTCMSNVSGVEKKWQNITRGKYTITNNGERSYLNVLDLKPPLSGRIALECQGSYGSRLVTAIAHVNTKRTRLFLLIFGLVIFVVGFLDYRRRKSNRRRQRRIKIAKDEYERRTASEISKSKAINEDSVSHQAYDRSIVTQDPSHKGKRYYDKVSKSYIYDSEGYLSPSKERCTVDVDVDDGVNG
ncbi:hypothetical protein HOLleu_39576 [Holothuria leucospilota]|uniref:Ig-like domain-containing protein n=1 Tax=Holothuria leucospilota TaxID=206669 RepID=A0A9Q0YHF6_HOLLE|nr:hypothetical protein HOLleu_39576 [Holothuria leucospilota]